MWAACSAFNVANPTVLAQELWQIVLLVAYPEGARLQPQDLAKDVSKDRHLLELSIVNMTARRPEGTGNQGASVSSCSGSTDRAGAEEGTAAGMATAADQRGELRPGQRLSQSAMPVHVLRLVKYAEQPCGASRWLEGLDASIVICSACVSSNHGREWDELCIIECNNAEAAETMTRTQACLPIVDEMVLITQPSHIPPANL